MVNPEFFDIFGILAFAIILIIGILIKFKRRKLPNNVFDWIAIVLIIIGVIGLIVDMCLVFRGYF